MNRSHRVGVLLGALTALSLNAVRARAQESKPAEKPPEAPAAPPKEESSVTDHTIKMGAQTILNKATAATISIGNDKTTPPRLTYNTATTRSTVKNMTKPP